MSAKIIAEQRKIQDAARKLIEEAAARAQAQVDAAQKIVERGEAQIDAGQKLIASAEASKRVARQTADEVRTEQELVIEAAEAVIAAQTKLLAEGEPRQYLVWDGGDSGPSGLHFSKVLQTYWQNRDVGDWLDKNQVPQGKDAYCVVKVTAALRFYDFDVTPLVRRQVENGHHRGFLLKANTSSATWSGRLSTVVEQRPRLTVTTEVGEFDCPCTALAGFSSATTPPSTRMRAKSGEKLHVIPQFDLRGIEGTPTKAVMRLYCEAKSSTHPNISVFELNPPRFRFGAGGETPRLGLAADGEAALKTKPEVIRAGDFSDWRKVWDQLKVEPHSKVEFIADPKAPGTIMLRGVMMPDPAGRDRVQYCSSIAMGTDLVRGDAKGLPDRVIDELYQRMYVEIEDDWTGTRDANKGWIGWDLRFGRWVGYWDHRTGNGGAPGDGRLHVIQTSSGPVYELWGHSIRMEAGHGFGNGDPNDAYRPLQAYIYSSKQRKSTGDVTRLGNVIIGRSQRVCIEQRLKMNSIVGPFDELGNGVPVEDGQLETWVDGVWAGIVEGLVFRCHPLIGIIGPWTTWYHGGKLPPLVPMHYRMNHVAVATGYIGPWVSP